MELATLQLKQNCDFESYVGNGDCDDFANTESCFYDGGDCCDEYSDFSYCKECFCHPDTPAMFFEKMPKTETVLEASSTTPDSGISIEPMYNSCSCLNKFMPIVYLLLIKIIKNF